MVGMIDELMMKEQAGDSEKRLGKEEMPLTYARKTLELEQGLAVLATHTRLALSSVQAGLQQMNITSTLSQLKSNSARTDKRSNNTSSNNEHNGRTA